MNRNFVKLFFAYIFAMFFALKKSAEIINTVSSEVELDDQILMLAGFKNGDN